MCAIDGRRCCSEVSVRREVWIHRNVDFVQFLMHVYILFCIGIMYRHKIVHENGWTNASNKCIYNLL